MTITKTDTTFEIRPVTQMNDIHSGLALYRAAFKLRPLDPTGSPRLLAALPHNGGAVLQAVAGDAMVGFCYAFTGFDPGAGESYLYLQAIAVDESWRGQGVGAALLTGMRDHATRIGLDRMSFAFDPMRAGNAYLYLDVLGATGRRLIDDLYGVEDTGRDPGRLTDRVIADWFTGDSSRADDGSPPGGLPLGELIQRDAGTGGEGLSAPGHWLAIPADWDRFARRYPEAVRPLQLKVREALRKPLAQSMELTSCRHADDGTSIYRIEPRTNTAAVPRQRATGLPG